MKRDWYVQRDENGRPDIIRSRCGLPIAWNTWESDDEEGDMALMAAAPDLLEACKNMLPIVMKYYKSRPDDGSEQDHLMTYYIEPARKAIAKAEGQTGAA